MAQKMASRLEEFFEERTDGGLRSIVRYEDREFEIEYLREDIASQYDEEKIRSAVDEAVMDSLSVPIYDTIYSEDHGDLTCLVQCYENVIEMNFVLSDGIGAAVAIDESALSNTNDLVADAREIVLEER